MLFLSQEPPTISNPDALNVVLTASRRGSITRGLQVSYRGIKVGEVTGLTLADDSQSINIFIDIAGRYAPLVRANTVFWNSSGFEANYSLFNGLDIKTESVAAIIGGGISFATPESISAVASDGEKFILSGSYEEKWLDWQPSIQLK